MRGETVPAQLELDLLNEQIETLKTKVFAPSTEKRPHASDPEAKVAPAPRRGHGPKTQPLLLTSTQMHTLGEEERTCPVCQGRLEPMGEQTGGCEAITIIEASYQVVTHRRAKYRCRCTRW